MQILTWCTGPNGLGRSKTRVAGTDPLLFEHRHFIKVKMGSAAGKERQTVLVSTTTIHGARSQQFIGKDRPRRCRSINTATSGCRSGRPLGHKSHTVHEAHHPVRGTNTSLLDSPMKQQGQKRPRQRRSNFGRIGKPHHGLSAPKARKAYPDAQKYSNYLRPAPKIRLIARLVQL